MGECLLILQEPIHYLFFALCCVLLNVNFNNYYLIHVQKYLKETTNQSVLHPAHTIFKSVVLNGGGSAPRERF